MDTIVNFVDFTALNVGQQLTVKDDIDIWHSSVMDRSAGRIFVHYPYSGRKPDEWILMASQRVIEKPMKYIKTSCMSNISTVLRMHPEFTRREIWNSLGACHGDKQTAIA